MKIITTVLIVIVLNALVIEKVQAAKSVGSAIVGKLVPAIMKCFGKKVTGVNMNKVMHIIQKAAHGFDKLSPSEIVYESISIAAHQLPWTKAIDIVLFGGQVIRVIVAVTIEGPKLGTAYIVEKAADVLEAKC